MTRKPGRLRAVFDCNTFVQAIAFDESPAAQSLRRAESGQVELLLSKPIIRELRKVLTYPEVLAISANMTEIRITAFLERLTYRGTLWRHVNRSIDFPRDPDDEPYLDLAIAANADFLVTRDKDLLWLMTGHAPICKRFRLRSRPLQVLTPESFLAALGPES